MKIKSRCLVCKKGVVIDKNTNLPRPCTICHGEGTVWVNSISPGVNTKKTGAPVPYNKTDSLSVRILNAIKNYQAAYLASGDVYALKPMRLKDIGDELKINPATVCVYARKMQINGLPVKELFGHGVAGKNHKAVLKLLKDVVDAETEPKSDVQLALELTKHGIYIARRTVTKYRILLGIGDAEARKLKSQSICSEPHQQL